MYNIMKASSNFPNHKVQAVRHRKRLNRSKNSSVDHNRYINPDVNFPKISNTGKLISKKMADLDQGKF